MRESFESFDKDKSGQLDLDEVVKLAESLGAKTTKKDLEALFKSIDANRDNKLSFDEFLAWYRVGKHSALAGVLKYQLNMSKAGKLLQKSVKPGEKGYDSVTAATKS